MIFKCNRCKKKFNYKKDKIPHIDTKEVCSKCYETINWKRKSEREAEKEDAKKKIKKVRKFGK